jgi:hypothetical protein
MFYNLPLHFKHLFETCSLFHYLLWILVGNLWSCSCSRNIQHDLSSLRFVGLWQWRMMSRSVALFGIRLAIAHSCLLAYHSLSKKTVTICFRLGHQGLAYVEMHLLHLMYWCSTQCAHILLNPSSLWTASTLTCIATHSTVIHWFFWLKHSAILSLVMRLSFLQKIILLQYTVLSTSVSSVIWSQDKPFDTCGFHSIINIQWFVTLSC